MQFKHTNLEVESFPKLIRDKIPQIIRDQGRTPKVKVLDSSSKDLIRYTLKKLIEEATEAANEVNDRSEMIKELADLEEIIDKVKELMRITDQEVSSVKKAKRERNGGFDENIILLEES